MKRFWIILLLIAFITPLGLTQIQENDVRTESTPIGHIMDIRQVTVIEVR